MAHDPWERYRNLLWHDDGLGMLLDVSRMRFDDSFLDRIDGPMQEAFASMAALESGAIANPDEDRMVGHYWLRAPELAPDPSIRGAVDDTTRRIRAFAGKVRAGTVRPAGADRFTRLLVIGIGGSALGPQFVAHALDRHTDAMEPSFVDNTDPGGIDAVLAGIDADLPRTLVVVISKSGGTKETRNGMFEVQAAFDGLALEFSRHAVAVTGEGSALHDYALERGFLDVFPMWDWVGGRTSETSAVGLLPAALQGVDIDALLDGAREMDVCTRVPVLRNNPAALLAAMWHHAGNGRGDKAMVVLPYKDRLLLFSRYLQQLVMESLGKEKDVTGDVVHQGLSVYGNKGSTDQHAFVQQLRDGRDDFFVTFIEVLADRAGSSIKVEEDATSGDYLLGFLLGTRAALQESGRESLTLTLPDVSPRSVGALIALYERAVGLYASLIGINAYHQPGVEAGKKAAGRVLETQRAVLDRLRGEPDRGWTVAEIADRIDADPETVFKVLEHMAANSDHGVGRETGSDPFSAVYRAGGGD
jgi:glucose-6-phosphate isomerase